MSKRQDSIIGRFLPNGDLRFTSATWGGYQSFSAQILKTSRIQS